MKNLITEEVRQVEAIADITSLIIQEKFGIGSAISAPFKVAAGAGKLAKGAVNLAKGAMSKGAKAVAKKNPEVVQDKIKDKVSQTLATRIKSMFRLNPELKEAFLSEAGEVAIQAFIEKLPPEIQEMTTPEQIMRIVGNIIKKEEPQKEPDLLQEAKFEDVKKRLDSKKFKKAYLHAKKKKDRISFDKLKVRILKVVPEDIQDKYKGNFLNWYLSYIAKASMEENADPYELLLSHLENFRDSIELYYQIKEQNLERFLEKKSVDQINSPKELVNIVNKARRPYKEYKDKKAYESTKIDPEDFKVFENDRWQVFIPHTKGAAVYLGRGTEWCTAAPGLNYYEDYHKKDDPLIIFFSKQRPKGKYQFHYGKRQFMNIEDKTIFYDGPRQDLKTFNELNSIVKSDLKGRIHDNPVKAANDYLYVDHGDGIIQKKTPVEERWTLNGKLHREDGPARITPKEKHWWLNGKRHREDGPAVIYPDGEEWYFNGKYHREGGPAVRYDNGFEMWYINGKKHREDGPAWTSANGRKVYYLKDEKFKTKTGWRNALKDPRYTYSKNQAKMEQMVSELFEGVNSGKSNTQENMKQIIMEELFGLLQEVKVEDVIKRLDGKKSRKILQQRFGHRTDQVIDDLKRAALSIIPNDIEEKYKGQLLNWYITYLLNKAKKRTALRRLRRRPLPSVVHSIETFFQIKAQRLDRFLEKSNLQDFESPYEIGEVVSKAMPEYQKYLKKKQDEERKNLNLDDFKIFENDQWQVFIPHTKGAAIVLGKGTDWCTAAPGLNYYEEYHKKDDPLIIFISKSDPKDKYQFHYGTRQFMNPRDKPIDKYLEEEEMDKLDPLYAEGERVTRRWYFMVEDTLFSKLNDMVIKDLSVPGYAKEQSKWQKKERRSREYYSDRDPYNVYSHELNENKNINKGNIMKEDMKQIILEELQTVLEEAGCTGGAHGRDTAIMPMGGPLASAIAPLPPIGGGCSSNPVPPPTGNPMGSEYDDTYMLVKSLEILSNQARTLLEAVDAGLTLPSWAEAKIYCAMDDIKSVHATLDRGGVPSGPQPPVIQLAEGGDLADLLSRTGVDSGPTLSTDRVSTGVHINKKLLNNAVGDMLMKLPLRVIEPPHFQRLKSQIKKLIMRYISELGGEREEPTIERPRPSGKRMKMEPIVARKRDTATPRRGKMEPIVARKRDTDNDLGKVKKELEKVNQELKDKPGSKRLKKKKAELEAKCGHLGKK